MKPAENLINSQKGMQSMLKSALALTALLVLTACDPSGQASLAELNPVRSQVSHTVRIGPSPDADGTETVTHSQSVIITENAPQPVAKTPITLSAQEQAAIKQLITQNAQAANQQDAKAFAETLHPDSPFLRNLETLFAQPTPRQAEPEAFTFQSQSADTVIVEVRMRWTDATGSTSNNGNYTLKREGQSWKILNMQSIGSSTTVTQTVIIDSKPPASPAPAELTSKPLMSGF